MGEDEPLGARGFGDIRGVLGRAVRPLRGVFLMRRVEGGLVDEQVRAFGGLGDVRVRKAVSAIDDFASRALPRDILQEDLLPPASTFPFSCISRNCLPRRPSSCAFSSWNLVLSSSWNTKP